MAKFYRYSILLSILVSLYMINGPKVDAKLEGNQDIPRGLRDKDEYHPLYERLAKYEPTEQENGIIRINKMNFDDLSGSNGIEEDDPKYRRIFDKRRSSLSHLIRTLQDREDKDYSFVHNNNNNNHRLGGDNEASKKIARYPEFIDNSMNGYRGTHLFNPRYQPQTDQGWGVWPFISDRDKRRRCQRDPFMAIKNPYLCDLDGYFGAKEYERMNFWDEVG